MFPKKIIEILQKHHNDEVLHNINDNISKIIENLYNVNQSIAEQIKNLLLDKDTDNNVQEIMEDSITLRDYIKSIQLLDIDNECLNNQADEISEELISPIIPKPVKLYLCEDNVCPICNCSMKDTYTSFTRKMESNLIKKNIDTYRCDCCGKFFVCDYILQDIDIKNTNLIINKEYYDKDCKNYDEAIVIFNINKCSNHNHKIEDMICELPIIISNGDVQYVSVPIIHCVTCNRYIMLKTVFDNLNGIPICSIIDESTNGKINFTENDFYYGDGNGSKLRQYGYNVNCIDKLTSEQRHKILSMHLKLKNITKGEIYSILNTNINRGQNRKDSKRNWSVAVSKWESDKKFVENLDIENDIKEININKLVLKFKKTS